MMFSWFVHGLKPPTSCLKQFEANMFVAGVASDTNKDMLNLLILSNVDLILESCQQKDYVMFMFSKRAKIQ